MRANRRPRPRKSPHERLGRGRSAESRPPRGLPGRRGRKHSVFGFAVAENRDLESSATGGGRDAPRRLRDSQTLGEPCRRRCRERKAGPRGHSGHGSRAAGGCRRRRRRARVRGAEIRFAAPRSGNAEKLPGSRKSKLTITSSRQPCLKIPALRTSAFSMLGEFSEIPSCPRTKPRWPEGASARRMRRRRI